MRLAILLHDAYGGLGGIAQFNRDFINACCVHEACEEVVIFQRAGPQEPLGPVPSKVSYAVLPEKYGFGFRMNLQYARRMIRYLIRDRKFDVVICGHIFFLPIAVIFAVVTSARLVLVMHGVDAWQPSRHRVANWLARRVPRIISVSRHTYDRFVAWSGNRSSQCFVLPNTVDLDRFRPGVDVSGLREKLKLNGKRVIFTLGRLSGLDRYKGYDEILEVLPALLAKMPDVVYVLGGDGDDRPRLERKAAECGVAHAVVFTGFVPEEEKVAYYNLADVFLLAGFGEGFGIVLLEALACGCQVIGSSEDGTAEALQDGRLGRIVHPHDRDELQRAIEAALATGRNGVPKGLSYYATDRFRSRVHGMLERVVSGKGS